MSLDDLHGIVGNTSPSEGSATVRQLLDRTVGPTESRARYLACVRVVAGTAGSDSAWLPWLVGDALARTVRADDSLFGDREAQVGVVSHVVALAVHHRWREVDDLDLTGDACFERIVTGVRTVESDDCQFFERIVRETATLLDEEYVGTAVLDWQDAFDGP